MPNQDVSPITHAIPAHLQAFVVEQEYEKYTAMDHAAWRMILRLSQKYFATHAHQKYLDGLKETGICIERIPRISEMDALLRKFGWRAVAVSGFIPPAIFMEFFSRGILPIACDMRMIENLTYTPAPDIVHEAAGHAPIIADPAYSAYLRRYGDVSTKAIFDQHDIELYLAVRNLSEVKENPRAAEAEIAAAELRLEVAGQAQGEPSEAALLARMNWWTVEYGLVGDPNAPKIYGAGLLSSLSESYHCLDASVEKVPLSERCTEVAYDITRPQPQLFVARDFEQLTEVLETFAATMAFQRGGVYGLEKAVNASTVVTVTLDSGLQISGKIAEFSSFPKLTEEVAFLKFQGPVQLSHQDRELAGHGAATHAQGFSSPLGATLEGDLAQLSFAILQSLPQVTFTSGYRLKGRVAGEVRVEGKRVILSWEHCTVWNADAEIVYQPEWGAFDLALGSRVVSVSGGAADPLAYRDGFCGHPQDQTLRSDAFLPTKPKQKTNLTDENRSLNDLYRQVREVREALNSADAAEAQLLPVIAEYERETAKRPDWLLKFELWELLKTPKNWSAAILRYRDQWEQDLKAHAKTKTPEGEVLTRAFLFLDGTH